MTGQSAVNSVAVTVITSDDGSITLVDNTTGPGSALSLSLSGHDLRAFHQAGITINVAWSLLRLR